MQIYEERFDLGLYGRISMTKNRGFTNCKTHFHRQLELHYITSGIVEFNIDGQDISCSNGLLFICPYQFHSNTANLNVRHISAIVSPDACGVYADMLTDYRPIFPFIPEEQVGKYFRTLVEYCESLYHADINASAYDNKSLLDTAMTCVVGEVSRHIKFVKVGSMPNQTAVRRVIDYCMQNLQSELSLDSISEALFLDKYYISKIFSNKIKISFNDFLNDQRIYRCCKQLLSTEKSITEIAFSNGFKNQSTFNRVFLERCGCTPSEFRHKKYKL